MPLQIPPSRRPLAIGVAIIGAVLLILLIGIAVRASTSSSPTATVDRELKATADRILPQLAGKPRLPIVDSTLNSYKAWVYDMQFALVRAVARPLPAKQFVQLDLADPNTIPPQTLLLNQPGRPMLQLLATTVNGVASSHSSAYTTLQQGGKSYRVYLVPLPTPSALQPASVTGVLEVAAAL